MSKQSFDINKLRVAAPCSAPWDAMTGDEKSRHCEMCSLNVYNFSEMTETEVKNLIEKTEGRICARLYKRADGTVLTKNCPVGIRAFYRRTTQRAGAALTAILALFSFGYGQRSDSKNEKACKTSGRILRVESRNLNFIEGTIVDLRCEVVPGAKITLINEDTKREYQVTSNQKGYYSILLNAPGRYKYTVKAAGFLTHFENLEINSNDSLQISVVLEVQAWVGSIVINDEKITIDPKSSSNTFRITRDMIEKQP
jgi:hypothetical protein